MQMVAQYGILLLLLQPLPHILFCFSHSWSHCLYGFLMEWHIQVHTVWWVPCSLTCFLHFLYCLVNFSFQSLRLICRHWCSHWNYCKQTRDTRSTNTHHCLSPLILHSYFIVHRRSWQYMQNLYRTSTFPHKITEIILKDALWPVSWATALAAKASVARVTMSSVVTVTMLISSDVDAPKHPSAPSSALPPATTSRFMPALPWWTVLTWERRLSTRLNPLPHLSQRNGFSPETARQREVINWRLKSWKLWALLNVELQSPIITWRSSSPYLCEW